jgi:uncharacterized protein involved in exopolysaccharide biosynthesis
MNSLNNEDFDKLNEVINEDIDLSQLIKLIWNGKRLIILITVLFALIAVYYALSLNNVYESKAILTTTESSTNIPSLGGLSGIAAMTGIALPSVGEDKATIALETIKSRVFLKHLIATRDILPSLLAAKSYNHQSNKIIFDPEVYDENDKLWMDSKLKNQKIGPSYITAHDTYLDLLKIDQDKFTNLISISMEHVSPVFAKEFLELIIEEINEILRNQDLQESSNAINFLTSEIPKSSLVTMKDALNQLVHSKLEMQMMAKISTDYALKIIEPPFVPEKKSKPNRARICILMTLFGGLLAVLLVFIRHYTSPYLKLSYLGRFLIKI